MVEMPPALPPVAACEIQAAQDYSVPLTALLAQRKTVVERVIRGAAESQKQQANGVYPIGLRWAQQLEVQFGTTPGALASDQCWGARATAYILRFNQGQDFDRSQVGAIDSSNNIPTIRAQHLDRSNAKPLSF
ncbi:hypothetical protein HBO07_25620 [Pseudomonas proteolytica]|uniref:hypothetical protein n=1 Tax=Pseudomonas proteolytica TaxID=219574 RepID=UPI0014758D4C|nr:hypothetical protein [Pseudomonas proteolytica]NMZ14655.1 hypothetical protein [Pseudomonas proteolytica]